MLKKVISLSLIFVLLSVNIAFAEILTNVEQTFRTTDEVMDRITEETIIEINGRSLKYDFDFLFYCDKENLEEQKKDIRNLLDDVEQIASEGTSVDYVYTNSVFYRRATCVIHFDGSFERRTPGAGIQLLDDYVGLYSGNYTMKNTEALMEYFAEKSESVLDSLTCEKEIEEIEKDVWAVFDFENKTMDIGTKVLDYIEVENVEFDITLDGTFAGSPFEELSDIGEKVHCTIKNLWNSWTGYTYTLVFEGNNNKIGFVNTESDKFSGSTTGRNMDFVFSSTLEGNTHYHYESGAKKGTIRLCGSLDNDVVSGASIIYIPAQTQPKIHSTNQVQAENLKYEYLWDEQHLSSGRNIYNLFGIPEKTIEITYEEDEEPKKPGEIEKEEIDEEVIKIEKEEDGVQNPERFVSFIKGPTKDGGYWDYDINFIARLDLNERRVMPDWYEALGDDVTATIMGLTHTFNGKVRRTSTMLRFQGSKDTIWFESGNTFFHEKEAGKPIVWECEYNSLLFFDGTTTINNTIDYETIDSTLQFSNDGNMTLEAITLEIYEEEFEMGEDEIKYISGGKEVYEKFN